MKKIHKYSLSSEWKNVGELIIKLKKKRRMEGINKNYFILRGFYFFLFAILEETWRRLASQVSRLLSLVVVRMAGMWFKGAAVCQQLERTAAQTHIPKHTDCWAQVRQRCLSINILEEQGLSVASDACSLGWKLWAPILCQLRSLSLTPVLWKDLLPRSGFSSTGDAW